MRIRIQHFFQLISTYHHEEEEEDQHGDELTQGTGWEEKKITLF
jgi:hypothetical protein